MTNEMIEKALLSAPNFNQGSKPVLVLNSPLHRALMSEGFVGANGGLTRKGSIKAEKLKSKQLDALFG